LKSVTLNNKFLTSFATLVDHKEKQTLSMD
jgi:hypothetical protein